MTDATWRLRSVSEAVAQGLNAGAEHPQVGADGEHLRHRGLHLSVNPALQPKRRATRRATSRLSSSSGNIANVPLVGAQQPMTTVNDLIAAAKAKSGTL